MEELLKDNKIIGKKIETIKTITSLQNLLIKVLAIVIICYVIFNNFFGLYRMHGIAMTPNISDGDLMIVYRLDKDYHKGDIVTLNKGGKTYFLRVVATAGQVVDITPEGEFIVNNHLEDNETFFKTLQNEESNVTFPLIVEKDQVFLLNDYRENKEDSRTFDSVNTEELTGKVITILRTKNV